MRQMMLQCAACVSLATMVAVEANAKPQPATGTLISATRNVAPGEVGKARLESVPLTRNGHRLTETAPSPSSRG